MKDLRELMFFLGIEFSRSHKGILMNQRKYALNLGEFKFFLGIEFSRSHKGMLMNQRKYALELIEESA